MFKSRTHPSHDISSQEAPCPNEDKACGYPVSRLGSAQLASRSNSQAQTSDEPTLRGGNPSFSCPQFVFVSAALRRLQLQAEVTATRLQLASVEGDAGTGKHLFAQNLHCHSALAQLPFRRRDAREWLANEVDTAFLSGTLYLDRVDLLAASGQGLLLNLVKSLNDSPPTRFALFVSSHASLRQLAADGLFIPDLAFRLTAVRFPLPPLRDHREDIGPITQSLVDRICRRYQQPTAVLAPGTLPHLLQHSWPGNVRELASVLESAILESATGVLRAADLVLVPISASNRSELSTQASRSIPLPNATLPANGPHLVESDDANLDSVIRRHIENVLNTNRGNKLRAARQLGISRSTLYRILAGGTALDTPVSL
jgi:two-component system response regulator AtoC